MPYLDNSRMSSPSCWMVFIIVLVSSIAKNGWFRLHLASRTRIHNYNLYTNFPIQDFIKKISYGNCRPAPSALEVVVGQISFISIDPDEDYFEVLQIVVNPTYNPTTGLNDIALLEVL